LWYPKPLWEWYVLTCVLNNAVREVTDAHPYLIPLCSLCGICEKYILYADCISLHKIKHITLCSFWSDIQSKQFVSGIEKTHISQAHNTTGKGKKKGGKKRGMFFNHQYTIVLDWISVKKNIKLLFYFVKWNTVSIQNVFLAIRKGNTMELNMDERIGYFSHALLKHMQNIQTFPEWVWDITITSISYIKCNAILSIQVKYNL